MSKYKRGTVTKIDNQFWVNCEPTDKEAPEYPWQLSILHDDSWAVKPGPPGPKGDSGKDGRDGISPPPAKDGERGADGQSIVWKGLFNRRTNYVVNDAVNFDGSSWIAVAPSQGREPSDTSRYWNVLAARGETGRAGRDGLAGPRGRSVRQYEIEERLTELENDSVSSVSAIFDSTVAAGEVVFVSGDGHVDLAQANGEPQTLAAGIAVQDVFEGATGEYVTVGPVTCETWNLTPGTVYYLDPDTPGQLTATYPTTPGDFVVILGAAATPTQLNLEIHWANFIE